MPAGSSYLGALGAAAPAKYALCCGEQSSVIGCCLSGLLSLPEFSLMETKARTRNVSDKAFESSTKFYYGLTIAL